jgi:hypothetical protein
LKINQTDRELLRRLAGEAAALAASIEVEKRQLWLKHNALQPTRPTVFCDPENGWNEMPPIKLNVKPSWPSNGKCQLRKRSFGVQG